MSDEPTKDPQVPENGTELASKDLDAVVGGTTIPTGTAAELKGSIMVPIAPPSDGTPSIVVGGWNVQTNKP